LGDAFFHFAKWVATLAAENPQIPFKLIMYLVAFAIAAPIIIFIIKVIALIIIFFNERRSKKRDRKEMIQLQRAILKNLKNGRIERTRSQRDEENLER
jgi:hypothetical protein